jgi:hypothetical protein
MSDIDAKSKPETIATDREAAWSPDPIAGATPRRPRRVLPVLLTVLVATAAAVLGQAMWAAYMAAPWTRDGTVRAYVVTVDPRPVPMGYRSSRGARRAAFLPRTFREPICWPRVPGAPLMPEIVADSPSLSCSHLFPSPGI